MSEEVINNPVIRFNEHGHRIYYPTRGSVYLAKYRHSKRQGNKVRALIRHANDTGLSLSVVDALGALRLSTKNRKREERVAKRKKHAVALSKR